MGRRKRIAVIVCLVGTLSVWAVVAALRTSSVKFEFLRGATLVADNRLTTSKSYVGARTVVYSLPGDWNQTTAEIDRELTAKGWQQLGRAATASRFRVYARTAGLPAGVSGGLRITPDSETIELTPGPFIASAVHGARSGANGGVVSVVFREPGHSASLSEKLLALVYPSPPPPKHSAVMASMPCTACHRSTVALSPRP